MKNTIKIILTVVGCSFIIPILGWLLIWGAFEVDYLFIPKPPKPEITYAEFPFALEYEVDGVYHKYEDVLICEFDGFTSSIGSRDISRKWEARYKSGNDEITLFENDEVEIFAFPVHRINGVPGAMMGDENLAEHVVDTFPVVLHRDAWTKDLPGKSYSFDGNEALMEKYKIRLISWECAPPIKNTFK